MGSLHYIQAMICELQQVKQRIFQLEAEIRTKNAIIGNQVKIIKKLIDRNAISLDWSMLSIIRQLPRMSLNMERSHLQMGLKFPTDL